MSTLLEVKDLNIQFHSNGNQMNVVKNLSFHLNSQEVLAIVGESGCGKSVTAKSIMQLLPKKTSSISKASIFFEGKDITQLNEKDMAGYRGSKISMIFQDPMTSLNPTMKVGDQIAEGLQIHHKISKKEAIRQAKNLIGLVGIPNPDYCSSKYPHQLSGGMRQRIVIAMALVCNPKMLIADEPTTALDVTIQAQILELLKELQSKLNMSIILITHDLGIVANLANRVMVMYAGRIVESGTVEDIFYNPKHPYTWGLLASAPRLDLDKDQSLKAIEGQLPDLTSLQSGCPFVSRCPYAMDVCEHYEAPKTNLSAHHFAHCWLLDERAPKIDIPIMLQHERR